MNASDRSTKLVVMFLGPPGSGKTTIGTGVVAGLPHGSSIYIDQDQYGGRRERFQNALRAVVDNSDYSIILVGKCHMSPSQRDITTACTRGCRHMAVCMTNTTRDVLVDRIMSRPKGTSTLDYAGAARIKQALDYIGGAAELTDDETEHYESIIKLTRDTSVEDKIQAVLNIVSESDPH